VELKDVIQISTAIIDLGIPVRDCVVLALIKHELEPLAYLDHRVCAPLTALTFTTG